MKYGSVCSGIEAASVAWHDLAWKPQWFSEIEQFPSEVLKYRFPHVPNLGDMTTINQNPIADERPIDLLVGGTPCQSFSVAGLRKGLADPRGNLMLTFLSIADKFRPKWVVWENVPGVLSSNGGKDFGTFLGALGELGYGFAYRVLDAQHFGVAQRRRRVFVVGYLGDWRVAAAVLFERESLSGNTKPSRKKGEEVASDVEGSVGDAGQVVIDRAAFNQGENARFEPRIEIEETMSALVARGPHAVAQPIAIQDVRPIEKAQNGRGWNDDGTSYTIDTKATQGVAQPIAFKVRGGCEGGGKGYLGQEDQAFTISATQDQQIAQPIAVDTYNQTINERTSQTIGSSASDVNHYGAVLQPIAVDVYNQSIDGQTSATITEAVGGTNTSGPKVMQPIPINTMTMLGRPSDDKNPRMGLGIGNPGEPQNTLTKTHSHAVATGMAIRRLTPKECERLQGFPDDWTKIPYRNKEADQCPDGPRYKACGNSMAVPVMRWIGERINLIESML
jgi:DNA (cytosine-5)-methyltransferase 1